MLYTRHVKHRRQRIVSSAIETRLEILNREQKALTRPIRPKEKHPQDYL